MKMNVTYPIAEVLDALNKANDHLAEKVAEMKRDGMYSIDMHRYVIENALTDSPFARITFTGRDTAGNVVGYMETSPWRDGIKTTVKVVEHWDVLVANDDYSNITVRPRNY